MAAYSERYCLFLDILGFADHVAESEASEAKINSIAAILDKVGLLGERQIIKLSTKVTYFSDSIVISFDTASASPGEVEVRKALLVNIQVFSEALVSDGYLVRGGLSLGGLCHEDKKVFGPAMVAAYRLEKAACYPRIKVSEEAYKRITGERFQGEINDHLTAILTSEGKDYFLDYLRRSRLLPSIRGTNDLSVVRRLNALSALIDKALAHEDACVKGKGVWVANIYDEEVRRYAKGEWGPWANAVETHFLSKLNRREYGFHIRH